MEFVNQDTATAEMVQIALDAINDMNSTLRGACLGESRLLDIIAPILEKIADCRQTIVEKLAVCEHQFGRLVNSNIQATSQMIQQLTTA